MREIVLATRSAGKIRELVPLVAAAGFRAVTLDDLGLAPASREDEVEVHDTFEANATAKARYFAALAPGRLVLADDSGLCVDALGGAPGVRSKRWAADTGAVGLALDAENNRKLARSLEGIADRRARYVCVAAIVGPGVSVCARGECAGRITHEARGANGFGYDPWFLSDELGVTFGEAPVPAKQAISHRGRAVRAALAKLSGAER